MKIRRMSDGKQFVIDERKDLVRAGGEGKVFKVRSDAAIVAKIYHEPGDRRTKLETMLRNPPVDDATPGHSSIAWPLDLLEDANGTRRFLGFVMPKVDRASGFHEFSNPTLRSKKHPQFTFRDLHIVASNAASAFWALHQKGYVVGDVNEGNLLIRDDALATVVDTDSFQVPKSDGTAFRCKVGREEFTPPELQGVTLADVDRETAHDLFGVGVLLFQLLMEGFHPFSGVPTFKGEAWPLGRRITDGNFPWGGTETPFKMPPLAPGLDVLDPRLQKLFIEVFDNGRGSGENGARRRPNARVWKRELDAAIERMTQCPKAKRHWYGGHLSSCPWCDRDKQLAKAGQSIARQRRIASAPAPAPVPKSAPVPKPSTARLFIKPPTTAPAPLFTSYQPPVDPAKYAEIQPGRWRLHPNPMAVQMTGGLVNADQVYDLSADGSMNAAGALIILGVRNEFTAQGYWSYDYVNKVLSMNGVLYMKGPQFANPFMKLLAQGIAQQQPPRPLNSTLSVVSGGNGRVMVRDNSNNLTFLFERL